MKQPLMKSIKRGAKKVSNTINKYSPELLTGLGLILDGMTIVEVAKKSPIVKEELDILHKRLGESDEEYTKWQVIWEETKIAVPIYRRAICTGIAGASCHVGSNRISAGRIATLATTANIYKKDFTEYKEKVAEMFGNTKKEKVESEIAKDEVAKTFDKRKDDLGTEEIISDGLCLCYDKMSGRYFRSSPELIRKAEAKLNKNLISEMYVSLNDLYFELGLSPTGLGDDLGWNIDEIIDITFNSIVAPDGQPCLVMEYLIQPRFDYTKLM